MRYEELMAEVRRGLHSSEKAYWRPWVCLWIEMSLGNDTVIWLLARWPIHGIGESQRNYGDMELEPLGEFDLCSILQCWMSNYVNQLISFSIKMASQPWVFSEYDVCTMGFSFPRSVTGALVLVCLLVVTTWVMVYIYVGTAISTQHISGANWCDSKSRSVRQCYALRPYEDMVYPW